jgi:hypothetical protein
VVSEIRSKVQKFGCLHLRIEEDWVANYNAYNSIFKDALVPENIADRMAAFPGIVQGFLTYHASTEH